jgi:hypothetical protein
MMELTPHPLLQHKLRLLIRALWQGPTADKVVSLVTTGFGYSPLQLDNKISMMYKKTIKHWLHKSIHTQLSYGTRQQDGIILRQRDTFPTHTVLDIKKRMTKKCPVFQQFLWMVQNVAFGVWAVELPLETSCLTRKRWNCAIQ